MKKKAFLISATLLLFLSFTPLLTAEVVVLQYDDNEMDASGARAGQAVRFTVPSEGYSCKLESLSIYVEQYDGNQTMMASIWADDGGNLMNAVGSLLFEIEKTVDAFGMYTVDLSDENINIPPGGSFFGGWTSDNNLMAYWDTTDPNEVTLQKFVGSPWLVNPPAMDAPVIAAISFILPELNDINPVSCARGSRVSVVIDANDAEFSQNGLSTIEDVWLSKDGIDIPSTGFIPTDSNSLTASFDIPTDAALGSWGVHVESTIFGPLQPLTDAFTLFASPDLNRDGTISINDINFFSLDWLKDINPSPNNILITVSESETETQSSTTIPSDTILLQYDDAELNGNGTELEGIGTLAGQAVRFTVPPADYSCKLESLSIYIEEFAGNQTMKASIWVDDGNDLDAAVQNLLFEEETTVGTGAWHTIDLSETNIIIPPGGSFFGGWTSDEYLMGFWDETEPNDMTLQKYLGFPWQIPPFGMDAPVKVQISYELPVLDNVSPAACARGTVLEMVVYANDAEFSQGENGTIEDVWLSKNNVIIPTTSFGPLDSNSLEASFDIPADAPIGDWDVYVESTLLGQMQPLIAAFTIFASPDLDRDGKVNINDFSFFSKHWQDKAVTIPVNVLIPAGQFEIGVETSQGNTSDPNTIIDEFYISNLEITNQQYCYFLNSAISKGEIKVVSDVVYSSLDAANDYAYFTCNPDLPTSQIQYSGGFFTVTGGKSRDMTLDPVVAVSWYGAAGYCNWRSVKEGKDVCYDTSTWTCVFVNNGYRLPTEAEWEYAARGGNYTPYLRFGWGDTISHNEANYYANSLYEYDVSETSGYHPEYDQGGEPYTAPAGSFAPNDYGLYDMSGNVWEWCNDWHDSSYYDEGEYDNPTGPASGNFVVIRGGSWKNPPNLCRTSNRNSDYPSTIGALTGFRVCYRP